MSSFDPADHFDWVAFNRRFDEHVSNFAKFQLSVSTSLTKLDGASTKHSEDIDSLKGKIDNGFTAEMAAMRAEQNITRSDMKTLKTTGLATFFTVIVTALMFLWKM